MALTTYPDLVASVSDWLMRDDLVPVIPSFIALAEAHLNRTLRLRQMVKTAVVTAEDGLAALPDDCLQIKTINAVGGYQLEFMSPTQLSASSPFLKGSTLQHYNVEGMNLRVLPANTADLWITYYARLPALSEDQPTSPILTDHPDIMLYATLLQSAPYLGDDQRGVVWKTLLDEAVVRAENADDAAEYAGHLQIRAD